MPWVTRLKKLQLILILVIWTIGNLNCPYSCSTGKNRILFVVMKLKIHFEFWLIFRRYFFISSFSLAHFDVGESLWDLGLSNEKLKDQQAVSNKILELENQMDLILVSERFDESLILLKVKRTDSCIVFTLKLESGSKITIFGLK